MPSKEVRPWWATNQTIDYWGESLVCSTCVVPVTHCFGSYLLEVERLVLCEH